MMSKYMSNKNIFINMTYQKMVLILSLCLKIDGSENEDYISEIS